MDAAVSRGPSLQEMQLLPRLPTLGTCTFSTPGPFQDPHCAKVGEHQGVDLHVQRKTFGLICGLIFKILGVWTGNSRDWFDIRLFGHALCRAWEDPKNGLLLHRFSQGGWAVPVS